MADIFQCPRCGAVTYREGISLHDRYHEERDREQKALLKRIEEADTPQLRNWPTPEAKRALAEQYFAAEAAPETADAADVEHADARQW